MVFTAVEVGNGEASCKWIKKVIDINNLKHWVWWDGLNIIGIPTKLYKTFSNTEVDSVSFKATAKGFSYTGYHITIDFSHIFWILNCTKTGYYINNER